ncbi:GXWXG domain-containing protein [Pseudorhizobium pelagicum]|uniref:GXWXG domain-containing protein n=1 Tax=Pseudorhizobium pelagicum TaxID=1509405 RepID=UPI0008516EA3
MKQTALQATLQTQVARWFRSLDPVRPEEMIGLWKGLGHPSGHPLDGVLENLHWFGKRFHTDLRADALLFEGEPGRLVPVDPKFFPIRLANRFAAFGRSTRARNLFSHIRPRVRAQGATANLRTLADDGVITAAMVYDRQPITDYFRCVHEHEIAGMMFIERDPRRYYFRLARAEARSGLGRNLFSKLRTAATSSSEAVCGGSRTRTSRKTSRSASCLS